jgi:hypothetical protein
MLLAHICGGFHRALTPHAQGRLACLEAAALHDVYGLSKREVANRLGLPARHAQARYVTGRVMWAQLSALPWAHRDGRFTLTARISRLEIN